MKDKIKFCELIVHYKNLFTKKQSSYMVDYFLHDQSYSEIAIKNNVSAMAVCDAIQRCEKLLIDYEKKLSLQKNFSERSKIYNQVSDKKIKKALFELDNKLTD